MEIKSSDSGLLLNQDQQEPRLNTTGELNLYLDLLAFSELSPEEQLADRERLKDASSNQVLEPIIEFPGFVEAADTSDGVLPSDETSDRSLAPIAEIDQREEEHLACEPLTLLEPEGTAAPVFEFTPAAEQAATSEHAAPEPTATVEANDLFRASGPLSLSGLLLDPTSRAAQVLRLAVCPTCGTESDGEDLFCVACGSFMDEQAVAESAETACDDCGLVVNTGDLICPSCGAVSTVC